MLPFFFVMHGFTENFGFINFWDVLVLAGTYIAAAIIIFVLFLLIFKNRVKSALAASFIMAFYLFFGAIQDFFKAHFFTLSKYSNLLLLFVLLFAILAFYLKKSKNNFSNPNLFLNSLFLIYVVIDFCSLAYKSFNPPANNLSIYSFAKNSRSCGQNSSAAGMITCSSTDSQISASAP